MFNTNPQIKKNNKKPLSCNVYRTNNHQRSPVRAAPTFKTPSTCSKGPEVLYFNEKILRRKIKSKKVLRECATQTSKTILQLAQDDFQNAPVNEEKPVNDNQNMSKVEEFMTRDNIQLQNFVGMQQNLPFTSENNPNPNMQIHGFDCQSQNMNMGGGGFYNGGQVCSTGFYNTNLPQPYTPMDVCNMNDPLNTQRTFNVSEVSPYDPGFFYSCTFPMENDKPISYIMPPDPLRNPNAPFPAAGDAQNDKNSPLKIGVQIHITNDSKLEEKINDTGRISPDSLGGSPREVTNNYSLENCSLSSAPKCLSDLTLEGSCHVQDCIYNNKPSLSKPLTQTFLEKNRARIYDASTSSLEELRSKSFVDNYYHPNYIHEPPEPKNSKVQRKSKFTETTNSKSLNLPDNSFPRTKPSMAASTLMRPTFASNIKSQREDIQTANSLIPSMRRGRSISPKPVANRKKFESSRKIPYIDQSRSDISSETTLVNATRHPEILRLTQMDENNSRSECSFHSDDLLSLTTDFDVTNSTINETLINPAMEKLCEPDWKTALRGLAEIVELCRVCDPEAMREYTHIINQRVVHLLRSPRSHVSRAACKAAGHLFEYIKDTKRPTFDEIVDILLYKTADTNKFIRHDANLALDCMVTHISISHAVRALCSKGPHHKNPLVRCATARLLVCAVVIAGTDFLFNPNNNTYTRKTIILTMAKLLEDKNLETRRVAERLYKVLSKDMRFDIYLRKYLEKEHIDKMRRNLIFIHKN